MNIATVAYVNNYDQSYHLSLAAWEVSHEIWVHMYSRDLTSRMIDELALLLRNIITEISTALPPRLHFASQPRRLIKPPIFPVPFHNDITLANSQGTPI